MQDLQSLFERFLCGNERHFWHRDRRVFLDGSWNDFEGHFVSSGADLIATSIRTRQEDPSWRWWPTLRTPAGLINPTDGIAALIPLARFSRRAAEVILSGIENGWSGHPEALIPTIVHAAGLKIEDVGGRGTFVPGSRRDRWYDERTWHWRGPVEFLPGMLHFPVSTFWNSLAPGRLAPSNRPAVLPRILFVSPVGDGAQSLLNKTLTAFLDARADCLVIQYDDSVTGLPRNVRRLSDRGHKWQLAIRHLPPAFVDGYDYLFFWDDDLDVQDFDPLRFVEIMRLNRLDMAQPAIESPFGICHEITARRPCPPPRLRPDGVPDRAIVGRLTNFVEIMAPVFTAQAWREFYGYLEPENRSGWGYDYIPLGRKGIVDALPVTHTRRAQSGSPRSEEEVTRFLASQGLFRHGTVNQGLLFEELEGRHTFNSGG